MVNKCIYIYINDIINVKNPLLEVASYPQALILWCHLLGAGSMPTGAEEYDFIAFAARISWLCQGRLRKECWVS